MKYDVKNSGDRHSNTQPVDPNASMLPTTPHTLYIVPLMKQQMHTLDIFNIFLHKKFSYIYIYSGIQVEFKVKTTFYVPLVRFSEH